MDAKRLNCARRSRTQGFTLVEMMVALVGGLIAIGSVFAVSGELNRQFFEQQRIATTQGAAQIALEELRHDIMRAGLFGTPNAALEKGCDPTPMMLPKLVSGTMPVSAFQYYSEVDNSVVDPDNKNKTVADRLRILGNTVTSDRYVIDEYKEVGGPSYRITLEEESQAFRRSFLYGYGSGSIPIPFRTGGSDTQFNVLIGAFNPRAVAHIETAEGNHFFRKISSVGPQVASGQVAYHLIVANPLPVGTACLPGIAKGATLAPLTWLEYLVIEPGSTEVMSGFQKFQGIFYIPGTTEAPKLPAPEASALEGNNAILVSRQLLPDTGLPNKSTTRVLAEWVANFEVSFLIDTNSGTTVAPTLTLVEGSAAETAINANPQQIRVVIIDLALRTPVEDPNLPFVETDGGMTTRYEADKDELGSSRVRHAHIEIPLRNLAGRNL